MKDIFKANEFVSDLIIQMRNNIKEGNILVALSGGINSTIVAELLNKYIKDRDIIYVHIDTGLIDDNIIKQIILSLELKLNIKISKIDARGRFFNALKDIIDISNKEIIIEETFLDIIGEIIDDCADIKYLALGTNMNTYTKKQSIYKNRYTLIEPLKELCKDEIELIGKNLKIPNNILYGKRYSKIGLGSCCYGEINDVKMEILKQVDEIIYQELCSYYNSKYFEYNFFMIPSIRKIDAATSGKGKWMIVIGASICDKHTKNHNDKFISYSVLVLIRDKILNKVRNIERVVFEFNENKR